MREPSPTAKQGLSEEHPRLRPGSIERWALDYVCTTELESKLEPPPPPEGWQEPAIAIRLDGPGRPAELDVRAKAERSIRPGALQHAHRRAQAFHSFLHHELQAAELMAWAILAFPETPRAFRRGLLKVAQDELRHMGMYRAHLRTLGFEFGDFPVRDWFWQRLPACREPAQFVAAMGIGLEGVNLDHAARFADKFREVGDEEGARIQDQVGEEEIAHVRFAAHWFEQFTGRRDFETWRRHLPDSIDPGILRQEPVNTEARRRAGLDDAFVETLRRTLPSQRARDRGALPATPPRPRSR